MSQLDEIKAIAEHSQGDPYVCSCGVTYGQIRAAVHRVTELEEALANILLAEDVGSVRSIVTSVLT